MYLSIKAKTKWASTTHAREKHAKIHSENLKL